MNLELAQKKLNKINRLIDTFEPGESAVSRLEKDLLLNYVKDLYEALLDESVSSPSTPAGEERIYRQRVEVRQKVEQKKPEPPKSLVFEDQPEEEVMEKLEAEKVKLPVEELTRETEVVSESATKATPTRKKEPQRVKASAAPEIEVKKTVEVHEPEVETLIAIEEPQSPEVEELFMIKKANEISEKLSQLPISDLNRAMGVNEKIFVKNELFAGDDNAFQNVIQKLNSLHSFEDAKNFLSAEVAYTYQWTDPEKKGKAKNFIQLVYRRYKDN